MKSKTFLMKAREGRVHAISSLKRDPANRLDNTRRSRAATFKGDFVDRLFVHFERKAIEA